MPRSRPTPAPSSPAGYHLPAGSQWASLSAVTATGARAAAAGGCDVGAARLTCLRGRSTAEVLTIPVRVDQMAYGTPTLPLRPADALRAGRFAPVPVLSGSDRDEHNGLIGLHDLGEPVSAQSYAGMLANAFGRRGATVAARYPHSGPEGPLSAWAAIATDRIWACPALAGAQLLARRSTVYGYEFADRTAPALDLPIRLPLHAYHGAELPYLFDVAGLPALRPDNEPLAAEMIAAWTGFAHTGTPGWPRIRNTGSTPYVRSFTPGADRQVDFGAEHQCDFWRPFIR